jgi:hypothetical protein
LEAENAAMNRPRRKKKRAFDDIKLEAFIWDSSHALAAQPSTSSKTDCASSSYMGLHVNHRFRRSGPTSQIFQIWPSVFRADLDQF